MEQEDGFEQEEALEDMQEVLLSGGMTMNSVWLKASYTLYTQIWKMQKN